MLSHFRHARWDLGFRQLWPQWQQLVSFHHLRQDMVAGATVACIAVPLSLAIALATDVSPAVGLISAIVGSVVCALFGGTPLAVSGPAAAMAILLASVVEQYGLQGLLWVGLGCGLLQIVTGVFGLARFIRFIPIPVVAGFTAGIGVIIFIGQLPRAFGLPPPSTSDVLGVLMHMREMLHASQWIPICLTLMTLLLIFGLPYLRPSLPAPLVAVIVPTVIAGALGLNVDVIGTIPGSLPLPMLPKHFALDSAVFVELVLMVYALASLETLLSSQAVDRLAGTASMRHDPDQEMIGQGLGNIAVAMFGGIPITGVIARSALNVHAGARTRRAAIIHAVFLVAAVFVLSPWMSRIPIAVLAGILLSVALRMMHPRELVILYRSSRGDAFIYALTCAIIVIFDLLAGVQAGIAAALVLTAMRFGRTQTHTIPTSSTTAPHQISISGALTFLSSHTIESLRQRFAEADATRGMIIDIADVSAIDVSGATQFTEWVQELQNRGFLVAIRGASPDCRDTLAQVDPHGTVTQRLVYGEAAALTMATANQTSRGAHRLLYGVERFRRETSTRYQHLFERLATGQTPTVLFITCSDSRINPNLITSTDPGELFILRNVGNIVPPSGMDAMPSEGAAVEYAIGVLGVQDIIVCGHSGCGAMNEVLSERIFTPDMIATYPSVTSWLSPVRTLKEQLAPEATPDDAAKLNALQQCQNLLTYPLIRERIANNTLRLHAWYYAIGQSELYEWDPERQDYIPVGSAKRDRAVSQSISSGILHQTILGSDNAGVPYQANQSIHNKK